MGPPQPHWLMSPPHSQVPRAKGRALSLQTLTHFSINGFLNATHAWNKPLTTGPPPDLLSPALLIHPPAPALLSRDAPRAAHCCGVSKQPGIRAWLPQAGSRHQLSARTLIREPTRAPAGKGQLSARDLAKATQGGPATCQAFFLWALPYSSLSMEELLQLQGRILVPSPALGRVPLPQHPSEPRAQREETSLSSQRKEIKITRRWRYRGIWPRSQNNSAALRYSRPTLEVPGHIP